MHIIFDLDGTLIDTALATISAFEQLVQRHRLPMPQKQDIQNMIGVANPEFYLRLFEGYDRNQVLNFGHDVELLEAELIQSLGKKMLFPGVENMLASLLQKNIRLSIASTGDEHHVNTALESTDIKQYFSKICCGEADKTAMLKILCAGQPCECLMIGDTEKDSAAAERNSIPSVAARYGYCSEKVAQRFNFSAATPGDILLLLSGRIN